MTKLFDWLKAHMGLDFVEQAFTVSGKMLPLALMMILVKLEILVDTKEVISYFKKDDVT